MGLFNLFKSKASAVKIVDMVWMSEDAKLNGSLKLLLDFPEATVISWFSDTQTKFRQFFLEKGIQKEVKVARTISSALLSDQIIFLEHYPLKSKEISLMQNWDVKKVIVLNSLDEPLFENFGSERIIGLMKTLGVKDDEAIENSMITSSIENAQEKLEKKVTFDNAANSSKEWFAKNISKI